MPDTNPFDDSFQETAVSTNPFEEKEVEASPVSNPFADDDDADDGDENNPHHGDSASLQAAGAIPAEASWQYLGDLPYRRVPVYSNVRWDAHDSSSHFRHGLSSFPVAALQTQQHAFGHLDPREVRGLLKTSTYTKVAGCPHGGPLAVITLPLAAAWARTECRIFTNAGGTPLAAFDVPPATLMGSSSSSSYTATDILELGFTSRTTLIIVMKDGLVLTYNLQGQPILPPVSLFDSTTTSSSAAPGGAAGKQQQALRGMDLMTAHVFEGGVAVLARNKQTVLMELLDEHDDPLYTQSLPASARRIQGPDSPHHAVITSLTTADFAAQHFLSYLTLAVLPRARTLSRHPEVFLSTADQSVVVVDALTGQCTDLQCRDRVPSNIVKLSFAPNGRFLACFTEASMLTVISTNFETKVLDFDTSEGSSSPPADMQWCGEDSVVLHWKNLGVLMVGPYGDWLRFPYEGCEHVYLLPEMDCCRVVTDGSVEVLQRVPPATAALLRIGSIETAAMLLDAADSFQAGSAIAEETIRSIETGLVDAIEICIDAATKEFDILTQKRLLRAASYGLHFGYKAAETQDNVVMGGTVHVDPDLDATVAVEKEHVWPSATTRGFVQAARKLRILNALRNPNVGFVLTANQYDAMTATGVVARLIAMKRPALATSIAFYLELPKQVQLYARAMKAAALVQSDVAMSDAETAEAARRILEQSDASSGSSGSKNASLHRGGYATVAMAATAANRPGVANLLLMLESSVADKVPALLSTHSYADAMAVATTARDADFIFSTLMEYERACLSSTTDASKAQSTFLGTVIAKFTTEAFHTLRRYLQTTNDVKSVTNLLLRAQRFSDAGTAMARRALGEEDPREKQGFLTEASRIYAMGKETIFHKSCTDDCLELLKDQEVLRTKYGSPDVAPDTLSVTATISSVIQFAAVNVREQHRLLADADKLSKKFRISEKRIWHIKVKAFADSNQWSNLRTLADSRAKPPIGFKPFARAAIKGKQAVPEIMRYVDRIIVPEERYDLFCEGGLWKRALEEASRLKDGRRILNVKSLCNSPELQLQADQMLGRLA